MRQRKTISPVWRNTINLQPTTYHLQLLFVVCCLLFVIAAPSAFAIPGVNGDPLIPCGTHIVTGPTGTKIANPCGICHIFALIQNIYNFIIFVIVPPIAILMVAIAGFFWLTSGGDPGRFRTGVQMLILVIKGMAMMYVAWLLVSFGIHLIANKNLAAYNPAKWYNPSSWFKIACDYNGSAYQCPDTGEIFASQIECDAACPQKCQPVNDQASGVSITVNADSVGKNTAVVLSWSIGKDAQAKPIDPKTCNATATSGAVASGAPLTSASLTNSIHSAPSGSMILDRFEHAGSYTFDITCGSNHAAAQLNVQACSADDIFLHWTDKAGNETNSVNVPGTAYATMDYDKDVCVGDRAIIDIINETDSNHTVDTKSVGALDSSGTFKIPYQATAANCQGADGDILTFRATVQVQGGSTFNDVDGDLAIICPGP